MSASTSESACSCAAVSVMPRWSRSTSRARSTISVLDRHSTSLSITRRCHAMRLRSCDTCSRKIFSKARRALARTRLVYPLGMCTCRRTQTERG